MPKLTSPLTQNLQSRLVGSLAGHISARGIKHNWVAARAGINEQYFGALLRGEKPPSLNSLILIGEALGLELKWEWRKK